jgi:DNA-damage-inducible protein J
MANFTVRIDDDVKKEAEILFSKLGMSVSGAINIFFRQAIREQGIPFQIKAPAVEEKYIDYFNPYNMKILKESIAELKAGKGTIKTMAELEAMENE